MTENEALKLGKSLYENITSNANNIIPTKEYIDFVGMAIQALEEIQQYRAIGTVEDFKALKEKSEPRKPLFSTVNRDTAYHCGSCKKFISFYDTRKYEYCHNCGTKIDWSE